MPQLLPSPPCHPRARPRCWCRLPLQSADACLLPPAFQEIAPFLRVLGSYPMDQQLGTLGSKTAWDVLSSADSI